MNYKYLDPYIDNIDYVRALRAKCLSLAAEGKTLISYSAEGTAGTKASLIPIGELLYETRMFIRDVTGQYPADAVKVFFA